jgi:hypothetical protein
MMTSRRDDAESSKWMDFLRSWGPVLVSALLSAGAMLIVMETRMTYLEREQDKMLTALKERATVESLNQYNSTMVFQHNQILANSDDALSRIGVLERQVDVNSNRISTLERKFR